MANPAINDITGDQIKTKTQSESYRKGWDRIFNKPKRVPAMGEGDAENIEEIKQWKVINRDAK